jgi:hypothetical protein
MPSELVAMLDELVIDGGLSVRLDGERDRGTRHENPVRGAFGQRHRVAVNKPAMGYRADCSL